MSADLLGFARTDYGNAERLHALYGHEFRYCKGIGFIAWDGKRWQPDAGAAVLRMSLQTARELLKQAAAVEDTERRAALVKHALSCERSAALKNAVDLTQTIPGVCIDVTQLDADPFLLNVNNGTLDLRSGALRAHDQRDLITKLAPVTFEPTAACPIWDSFQHTICDGDSELISFKRRAYGYSLTGDTGEQCLFIPYGTGANGKSTELDAISGILGEYGNSAQFETFAVQRNDGVRNDVADLVGARFVSASEGESQQRLAEGLVKQLTGGDVMKARFLHKEFFKFKPTFKLWLATNHKPVIRGTEHAIWRRIRLIPYGVTIPPEKRDNRLKEKLEQERSGILNWLLDGCRAWLEHGLGKAAAVSAATESYREESDVLADFITARCVVGENFGEIAADLYRAYERYCTENGDTVYSNTLFGRMLTERGYEPVQKRFEGLVLRVRSGLCLVENSQKETGVYRS